MVKKTRIHHQDLDYRLWKEDEFFHGWPISIYCFEVWWAQKSFESEKSISPKIFPFEFKTSSPHQSILPVNQRIRKSRNSPASADYREKTCNHWWRWESKAIFQMPKVTVLPVVKGVATRRGYWYQQDEGWTYVTEDCLEFLKAKFGDRVISRRTIDPFSGRTWGSHGTMLEVGSQLTSFLFIIFVLNTF